MTQPATPRETEIRNYWRSRIISGCMLFAGLLELVGPTETEFGKLPSHVYEPALHKCRELLDWACREEARLGHRARSIDHTVAADTWNFLKLFKPAKSPPRAGETAQLEFQPRIST